jgi:hypothetical protein
MLIKCWSEVNEGVNLAHISIDNFSGSEKTQAGQFGSIQFNLGGVFAGSIGTSDSDPNPIVVNFAVAPIQAVIDPNGEGYTYDRTFTVSPETPVPGAAATCFCQVNMAKIQAAVAAWKALTSAYAVNIQQTV